MFEKIEYQVERIEGDYAYLRNLTMATDELKCVARALLPEAINQGSYLVYEMLAYELVEG
ncbi:MAG: chorismate--pyruvate lyase [Cellulosilyticaceae bacterium]